ncbi:MAG: ATP-binding cassette domain-containing protein [Moraxella sp.]|nr:ATP-binding cassette domain-containing protein [Moraxella sp.]
MKADDDFKLRHLLTTQKTLWLIAWLLGVTTVVSVLGLVMLAGWFITMTAVAGVLVMSFNYLIPSAIIRLFAITRTTARYGDLMVSHHAVFGLLKQLRVKFFARWASLPIQQRQATTDTSSQTMYRLVKDIDVLDELPLRLVSPYVVAFVAMVGLSVFMVVVLPLSLWVVACVALTFLVAFLTLKRGISLAKTESTLTAQRQSKLLDTLPATHLLMIWGRWGDTVDKLTALDKAHHDHTKKIHALRRNTSFINQLIMAVAVCVAMWLAHRYFLSSGHVAMFADGGHHAMLNPALMLAVVLGLFGLIEIIMTLTAEPLALGRSYVAKERINGLIGLVDTLLPKTPLSEKVHTLSLQNVSVKMPNAIIATDNINATFSHDKPNLIIGASGVGKSTLLATLAGEIPLVDGQMMVNGVDYQTVDFGSSLGFLGQNVDIFDQTLADNLRLGKPSATDDELWAVLDKVGLSDWAKSQPKGLDTPLGEYGMAISGGQGRRVALARLLLSPKEILLLDEPFAGLDVATRKSVWQSLTDMQQQGKIGVLIIATHQVWEQMGDVGVLEV